MAREDLKGALAVQITGSTYEAAGPGTVSIEVGLLYEAILVVRVDDTVNSSDPDGDGS